jgi:hypothetical protein
MNKQETLEETIERLFRYYPESTGYRKAAIIGKEWQMERSYSEEEVHHIIQMYSIESYDIGQNITYDEWFEQFKKK